MAKKLPQAVKPVAVYYAPLRSFMFLQGGSCPANCIYIIYNSIKRLFITGLQYHFDNSDRD